MRRSIQMLLALSLAAASAHVMRSSAPRPPDPDGYSKALIDVLYRERATPARLDALARERLAARDVEGALEYRRVAGDLSTKLAPDIEAALAEQDGVAATALRMGESFVDGALNGRVKDASGLAGALVARKVAGPGDRAAIAETYRDYRLGRVDEVSAGLSLAGASSRMLLGDSVPGGVVSLLLRAEGGGGLPSGLESALRAEVSRLVDYEAVKDDLATEGSAQPDPGRVADAVLAHIDRQRLELLKASIGDIWTVLKETRSPTDTYRLLAYAASLDDVRRLRRLAEDFGTGAYRRAMILGRAALHPPPRRLERKGFTAAQWAGLAGLLAGLGWSLLTVWRWPGRSGDPDAGDRGRAPVRRKPRGRPGPLPEMENAAAPD